LTRIISFVKTKPTYKTAAREKLPFIEVIVNNHVLGMVRQWQDLFYEKRYSATVLDDGVDFVKLAEAMGAQLE